MNDSFASSEPVPIRSTSHVGQLKQPVALRSADQGVTLASGDPCGFMFNAQGTQHIVYKESFGAILELFWDAQGWHNRDASFEAERSTPFAEGNIFGYTFEPQGSLHAIYRASDGSIHELYRFAEGIWRHTPSSANANAPSAASDPSAYVFAAQNTQHIVYRAKDSYVHEIYWQGDNWSHTPVGTTIGAPKAVGIPSGYVFDAQGTQHIIYRGEDDHIHELYWDTFGWHHHDPTDDNGAPDSSGDPVGFVYSPEGTQHIFYRGKDNHIHELLWKEGNWSHSDLTATTGAPDATSDPSAYVFTTQATLHVMFRVADNNIYELFRSAGNWYLHNPTGDNQAPKTDGKPSGYMFDAQTTQHVVYRGKDNHIHEVYWQGGNWAHTDASYDARTLPPNAPTGLRVTGVFDRQINLTWIDQSTNEASFSVHFDGKLSGSGDDTGTVAVDANVNSTSLTGLKSNFRYSIYVQAIGEAGNSANSNTVTATTPARIISATKTGTPANTTFNVTGTGFSSGQTVALRLTSPAFQQFDGRTTAGGDGHIAYTTSFPCQAGIKMTVTAWEDADPEGTEANSVDVYC